MKEFTKKEKERVLRKLKRRKREMKKEGASSFETKKIRRAIKKLREGMNGS